MIVSKLQNAIDRKAAETWEHLTPAIKIKLAFFSDQLSHFYELDGYLAVDPQTFDKNRNVQRTIVSHFSNLSVLETRNSCKTDTQNAHKYHFFPNLCFKNSNAESYLGKHPGQKAYGDLDGWKNTSSNRLCKFYRYMILGHDLAESDWQGEQYRVKAGLRSALCSRIDHSDTAIGEVGITGGKLRIVGDRRGGDLAVGHAIH